MNQNEKKSDDELPILIIVNGIFTIALLAVDFLYSNWSGMFHDGWIVILPIVLHILSAACWYIALANWQNPNWNSIRVWLLASIIGSIISVASYRAYSNELKSVQEDANKAKQEQLP